MDGSQITKRVHAVFYILTALLFLIPLFVIPNASVGISFAKGAFIAVGVFVGLIVWAVMSLWKMKVEFPHWQGLIFLGLLPLTYVISALASQSVQASFLGGGFSADSAFMVIVFALLAFLVAAATRQRKFFLMYYIVLSGSLFILALVHIIRLIGGPGVLSFGVLTIPTASLIGGWNSLAIFFGLGAIISLIVLQYADTSKVWKFTSLLVLVVSLLGVAVVNFVPVWYGVGIVGVLMIAYYLSTQKKLSADSALAREEEHEGDTPSRNLPLAAIIIFVVAVVFIVGNTFASDISSRIVGASHVEVRPSWGATLQVADDVLDDAPITGVGPNRFREAWLAHKPPGINETNFWNVEFRSGIGVIPTSIASTGALGFTAWILLIGFMLYNGVRLLMRETRHFNKLLLSLSLVGAVYLWAFLFVYTPSIALVALTFFFTGLFMASMHFAKKGTAGQLIQFSNLSSAMGFLLSLALIILIIGGIFGVYLSVERFVAEARYQESLTLFAQGETESARTRLRAAIELYESDVYYRALAGAFVQGIQEVLATSDDTSIEVLRGQFQSQLTGAIQSAQRAVDIDSTDYRNWSALAEVYASVAPLNISGAADNAETALVEAVERNPAPNLYLSLARLAAQRGENDEARAYIAQALEAKRNYTPAVYLLAQIQLAEGNTEEAIRSTALAAQSTPNNPVAFFQLGLLYYSVNQFDNARSALEQAITIDPQYANARYFLGLSYHELDRQEDAIEQFRRIQETNPDNEEVAFILNNLRNDRDPFANVEPPIDDEPESRVEPPITEEE